jgi:hypothetical protein
VLGLGPAACFLHAGRLRITVACPLREGDDELAGDCASGPSPVSFWSASRVCTRIIRALGLPVPPCGRDSTLGAPPDVWRTHPAVFFFEHPFASCPIPAWRRHHPLIARSCLPQLSPPDGTEASRSGWLLLFLRRSSRPALRAASAGMFVFYSRRAVDSLLNCYPERRYSVTAQQDQLRVRA